MMWRGVLFLAVVLCVVNGSVSAQDSSRPNILFCIADDWGWPHAGVYGDAVVQTPTFDRLAREGMLFRHAYVSSPSCTPSRNAILTGQHFWRLGPGANLHSTLPVEHPVYPLLLEQKGYFVGHTGKSFGPGDLEPGGYKDQHPAGKAFKSFDAFLKARPADQPFCFWFGSSDPHRPYDEGSGVGKGIKLENIEVPPFLPDNETVRSDIADYYFEVERFDGDVGKVLAQLEKTGELDHTIIAMTGDHGWPFPRGKGNLYNYGSQVPLAVRWGNVIKAGSEFDGFVSLPDLAPTFLQAAGASVPELMTYRSLLPIFKTGQSDVDRSYVVYGRERHVPSQMPPSQEGYPSRAYRSHEFLYIENLKPDLWPMGRGDHPTRIYADCDAGPTRSVIVDPDNTEAMQKFYDLTFAKRPAVELYDVSADAYEIRNVAEEPQYADVRERMAKRLQEERERLGDPRANGDGEELEGFPYLGNRERKKPRVR